MSLQEAGNRAETGKKLPGSEAAVEDFLLYLVEKTVLDRSRAA